MNLDNNKIEEIWGKATAVSGLIPSVGAKTLQVHGFSGSNLGYQQSLGGRYST